VKKQNNISKGIVTGILLVFGLLFVMPLLWMLSASLKRMQDVFSDTMQWIPRPVFWSNYAYVWSNPEVPYIKLLFNSLKIAILSIAGQLIVSATAAYAFARIRFPGRNVFFMAYLATMMIPFQVTIIPRFVLFNRIGLYNTHWAVILPHMFTASSIFLLKRYYEAVPNDLMESAWMDGAKHFRIWTSIMIPLTKHAMASLVILNFISIWNDYMNPLIFLNKKILYTVSLGIEYYNSQEIPMVNMTMVASVLAIIPILAIYIFFQKYFVQSIVSSGIKG